MTWRCLFQPCVARKQVAQSLRNRQYDVCFIPSATSRSISYTTQQSIAVQIQTQELSSSARSVPKAPIWKHSDLLINIGPEAIDVSAVRISGLIRSIRKQKRIAFAHISDGTTLEPLQAILTPEQAKDLNNGTFVELAGRWQASSAKGQICELQVEEVLAVGETDPDEFPIQKKSLTNDFLRTVPHLRFRTPFYSLLSRVRNEVTGSIQSFYRFEHGTEAMQVHPPIITSSDCEGAGEVFTINPKTSQKKPESLVPAEDEDMKSYFREPKYLTVSSQLHLEAYSAELGDVWALSPTFRAEESDTARHLAEFYMLEAELRMDSLEQLQSHVQDLVTSIVSSLKSSMAGIELLNYYADPKYQSAVADPPNLQKRWDALVRPQWTRISYADAMNELVKTNAAFDIQPSYENGLNLEHERWIVENIGQNGPVFVSRYPKVQKPFYMLPTSSQTSNSDTVECFDLLLPHGICEVAGGSLREHRLEPLISAMRDKGMLKSTPSPSPSATTVGATYPHLQADESLGSLQWYADLRRFGSGPHGGFGLGFDRLLAYLTGLANVRDVVAFPRTWGRADC